MLLCAPVRKLSCEPAVHAPRHWDDRKPILDRNLYGAQIFALDLKPEPEPQEDLEETKLPMFEWFKALPAYDSMILKGKLIEIDPSYDTEAMIKCGTCGASIIAEITAQSDFFAPTGRAASLKANYS